MTTYLSEEFVEILQNQGLKSEFADFGEGERKCWCGAVFAGEGLKKMCREMRGVGKVKENGYGNARALPSFVGKVINLRASSGFMPLALLNVKSAS